MVIFGHIWFYLIDIKICNDFTLDNVIFLNYVFILFHQWVSCPTLTPYSLKSLNMLIIMGMLFLYEFDCYQVKTFLCSHAGNVILTNDYIKIEKEGTKVNSLETVTNYLPEICNISWWILEMCVSNNIRVYNFAYQSYNTFLFSMIRCWSEICIK